MPKGKQIINKKQKRAAHWAVRFLRLCDFVTTISTARRNFSFLWSCFTLLTTRSTAERVYVPFGKAGMGLLDKASLVGLVSDLCAFSALITAIIVRIAAF